MNEFERQLYALLQNSSDMITVVGPDTSVLYQTGAAQAVTGQPPEALVGARLADWVVDEDVPALLELCQTVDAAEGELRLRHADGSVRMCEVRATGLLDEGAWWGAILTMHDVTEKKRLELELRLAQKLESVGHLAAGVAHEVNTPVQYISSSVHFVAESFSDLAGLLELTDSILRAEADDGRVDRELVARVDDAREAADVDYVLARVPEALTRSLDGLRRVGELVAAMRTFARPPSTTLEPVDVNAAIANTLIVSANEYKHVATVTRELDDVPLVPGAPGDLNQVLLNLIVNASHAIADVVGTSGEMGSIHIRSYCEADEVVISVADTGGGIPEDIGMRVFDPFFTTKEVGRGTGQGLAISRTIMKRHHGSLTFESRPGDGTTFVIRLPLGEPSQAEPALVRAGDPAELPPGPE